MDERARGGLVALIARIADPVGKAIAAKARQPHQIDILRVVAMAQMAHQPAKRLSRLRIVKRIQRAVFLSVSLSHNSMYLH